MIQVLFAFKSRNVRRVSLRPVCCPTAQRIHQSREVSLEGRNFLVYMMWVGRASFTFHPEHWRNTNPLPSRSWKKCGPLSGGAFPPRYPHLLASRLTGTSGSWTPCRVQGTLILGFSKGIYYAARLSQQFGAISHRNETHRGLYCIYFCQRL